MLELMNVNAWTVDYKGMLTGTRFRRPKRLISSPTCPPLIRKNSFFRSAVRDGDGRTEVDA